MKAARTTTSVSAIGVVLGLALLVSAWLRAYGNYPGEVLGYLRLASQATVGACLVFYFALGNFKPIAFAEAEIPSRDTAHARPGFAKFGRNPVLAKYARR